MHVEADRIIPVGAEIAEQRLGSTLRRLEAKGRVTVGPTDSVAKMVRLRTGGPRTIGRTAIRPLRWQPTGVTAGWFPSLDARLALTSVDATTSMLSLSGTYWPPFGPLGRAVHRAGRGDRVAHRTVASFLEELAAEMRGG